MLTQAYYSIPHNKLWEGIKVLDLNRTQLKMLKKLYSNSKALLKFGNNLSRPISVTKGLYQGYNLSPIFFNLFLEVALDKWKWHCSWIGMRISGKHLYKSHFAYDKLIIAQESCDLKFMLNRLYFPYKNMGISNESAESRIFSHKYWVKIWNPNLRWSTHIS